MIKFSTLLVANRGEIALRIMRTAREIGLKTVAVYTRADKCAPHVAFADRSICIGEGPVGESYLSIPRILAAAKEAKADAIHPGYGFLSENADFVVACEKAGLVFIGPTAEAVALMGNKAAAKRRMIAAGVPCVPGYQGPEQTTPTLFEGASQIGYPVMIKAAAGGGGRGMRLVATAADFDDALQSAKSEALKAFGSDEVILERAISGPRHVEIQVFADQHGNVVHMGERDCSVQRRHQKVVEESPCPVMTLALRSQMGSAAVEAAKAISYQGAGTVEFLLDVNNDFYFLEMNTRLQVEHPVTEMVTGLDLVALQLNVAQGEPLGFEQKDIALTGHAIEVRLYAEDPARGFLPSTGKIEIWQPPGGPGIRVDSGIVQGQELSAHYDPLLAKIIAHGATREQARKRLKAALGELVLFGPTCNRDFLRSVLGSPVFASGQATTAFIAEEFGETGFGEPCNFEEITLAAAMLYKVFYDRAYNFSAMANPRLRGFGSPGFLLSRMTLADESAIWPVTVRTQRNGDLVVRSAENEALVSMSQEVLRVNGQRIDLKASHYNGDRMFIATSNRSFFVRHVKASARRHAAVDSGRVTAPMHGNLLKILVAQGDLVSPGTKLGILEAMKMQHELLAEIKGTVVAVLAESGSQVQTGQVLIEIEKDDR